MARAVSGLMDLNGSYLEIMRLQATGAGVFFFSCPPITSLWNQNAIDALGDWRETHKFRDVNVSAEAPELKKKKSLPSHFVFPFRIDMCTGASAPR